MIRKLIVPALIVAAAYALPSAASAHTYFGVSIGSGYGGYNEPSNGYDYSPGYYDEVDQSYAWNAHEQWEQQERAEEARQRHWDHERREHGGWSRGDDDDD